MSGRGERRRPRRATRPATGGVEQHGGRPDPTSDDVDLDDSGGEPSQDDDHGRWLREQRPPHWE